MKRTKKQNVYEVLADLSSIQLSKAKNSFQIICENSVLGTLQLSRGSIQWITSNGKKPVRKLNWKQFADLMETK